MDERFRIVRVRNGWLFEQIPSKPDSPKYVAKNLAELFKVIDFVLGPIETEKQETP